MSVVFLWDKEGRGAAGDGALLFQPPSKKHSNHMLQASIGDKYLLAWTRTSGRKPLAVTQKRSSGLNL